jgi:DNA polymerase-3 subunit epsilon
MKDLMNLNPEDVTAARPLAYVIADTETTGLDNPIGIVELALRRIDPETLETVKEWASLINPEREIHPGATNIHGITSEMVADEPTLAEFVEQRLNGELADHDVVFIAHNVPFDLPLCTPVFTVVASVCTLFWSRQLVKGPENNKLPTLAAFFGIPTPDAHRAPADVQTTHELLKHLLRLSGRTLPQLAAIKEQTVHVMPFGRHKGEMVLTLPKDYLDYMLALPDLEANLRASMEKARRLK